MDQDKHSKQYDAIIIGAGAAGLMCAIEAGRRSRKVLLIDHARSVGEKIRISGGGRCNFTNINASPANYLSQNPRFCISALKRYTQHDFIKLVNKYKISHHEKTLGQLFCDGSSQQIIDMLLSECHEYGVEIRTMTPIEIVRKSDDFFTVRTKNNDVLSCESLVIATGGPSIPKMGATSWGYKVAEQFGLNVIAPRAALVPFTLDENTLAKTKTLSGVSLNAIVSCNKKSFKEAILFTHRGLSGPAILQISSYWSEGQGVEINLSPDRNISTHLKEARQNNPKQEVQTILSQILPKKLTAYICEEYNYHGRIADFSNPKIEQIADNLHRWKITPNGTEGYRTAEVTIGGVDTDELSSKTFEAKKVPGLYFIGEVIDVTGHLGGYNFQWAWSSGVAAGSFI